MTFGKKIAAGFGTALAILILVGSFAYRSMVKSDEDRVWVMHTRQVLEKLEAVLADLLNVETGARGYALGGDESYLEPYTTGLEQVHQDESQLRELTSDNPVQQHSLDLLDPLIEKRLELAQTLIKARANKGVATIAASTLLDSGKVTMDQVRVRLAEMKGEENRLLKSRTEEAIRSSRSTRILIAFGGSLAVGILCFSGIVVGQEMKMRRRAEEAVTRVNLELEKRVGDRTAELSERAKDLARSNSELQQFAYVASHDLQEPLRMVASFTQLLARRYSEQLDDDARDFIQFAVDGATRMQTLISDLLNYSRVGTQGKPLVPTDSEQVLQPVLENLKYSLEESGAEISHEPMPWVMADATQLGQLFQNLVSNAIKFRSEIPPRIQISAEKDGRDWKISVRDNGIGIAPEHADRVFIIFQRLHTKTEYPGTGIGLAISKKIIERHGGRIWIEPSPGGGTTFCFTLTAAEKPKGGEEANELRAASKAH